MSLRILLIIAGALDALLALILLLAPALAIQILKMSNPPDQVTYLLSVNGGFCILAATLCFVAIKWLKTPSTFSTGRTLAMILGGWWLIFGTLWSFQFGQYTHLALDALKGLLILIAARRTQ